MKIIFRKSSVQDFKVLCEDMIVLHWEELCRDKEKISLNVNWADYQKLEDEGKFLTTLILKDNGIIGYALFTLFFPTHYQDSLHALNNAVYLNPAYRDMGIGGKFIRYLEEEFRDKGVKRVYFNTKVQTALSGILEHYDYQPEEIIYSKYIGD